MPYKQENEVRNEVENNLPVVNDGVNAVKEQAKEGEEVTFTQSSLFSAGACGLCSAKLWRYKKNYTCNSCSKMVCAKCSTFEVTEADAEKTERVCNDCAEADRVEAANKQGFFAKRFNAVKKAMPKPGVPSVGKLPGVGNEKVREMEDVADYQRTLPAWLFLLKPFHEEGKNLAIGALAVKVEEAKNLPAMDRFGTSDPFCEVYLTQPGGEEFKQRTKTKFKTLTPTWNAKFSFKVTTTLCSLHVNLYDYDASDSNDLIGSVEIPLGELAYEGKVMEDWFTLKLSDEAKEKVMKNAIKHGKKNSGNLEAPQVKLSLMYDFSRIGEFASHFTDNTNQNIEEPKFDMDVLYSTGMKLMELTQPMVDSLGEVDHILRWTDPFKSFMFLLVFMLGAAYPFTIPIMIELFLIRYMFWQYVLLQWKAESLDAQSPMEEDGIDTEEAKRELQKMKAQKKAEREGHLNGLLADMATSSVSGAGMTETLQWIQNLLVYVAEMLEYVLGLFQWVDPIISKVILASLCLGVLYSCFLPFSVIVFFGGSYVICMQTVPGQLLYWFAMSLITYLTRPKPIVFTKDDLTNAAQDGELTQDQENVAQDEKKARTSPKFKNGEKVELIREDSGSEEKMA